MNEGFDKEFYRKGNSVKRLRPFSETSDFEMENICAHPLPKAHPQFMFWEIKSLYQYRLEGIFQKFSDPLVA